MTTSGTLITMNNNLTSIIENVNGGESIISGGAIRSMVPMHPFIHWAFC